MTEFLNSKQEKYLQKKEEHIVGSAAQTLF